MRSIIAAFSAGLIAFTAIPAFAQIDDCNQTSFTVDAAISTDPGFEGLWKYTVSGSWDVGAQALSHIDFFLALQNCECVCHPGLIQFAETAGTSDGTQGGETCTVGYVGEYLCMGDPSIPEVLNAPTLKFDASSEESCEPETSGTGSWCFYTPLPPALSLTYFDAIAIKHGQQVCTGDLSGTLPQCDCTVPVEVVTWGRLKGQHH